MPTSDAFVSLADYLRALPPVVPSQAPRPARTFPAAKAAAAPSSVVLPLERAVGRRDEACPDPAMLAGDGDSDALPVDAGPTAPAASLASVMPPSGGSSGTPPAGAFWSIARPVAVTPSATPLTLAGMPPSDESTSEIPNADQSAFIGSPLVISESDERPDEAAALRDCRLFRAALADAFDALLPRLVREFADVVLGRELELADVDVQTIARRLIAERCAEEPVRLRVAPADRHLACELPVAVDERLQPGDAILECRNGEIDARLHVRLEQIIESVAG